MKLKHTLAIIAIAALGGTRSVASAAELVNAVTLSRATNATVAAADAYADSDAEIRTILAMSKDTAIPDDMIIRVVSNECATAQGRVKWHGKILSNVIDTNALTRTQTHEDGFVFVERFKSVQAIPVVVRLSAAERKAKQEAAARAKAEAEAKRKADRIADLQTNMVVLATSFARQKQYPLDLATMLLQHELRFSLVRTPSTPSSRRTNENRNRASRTNDRRPHLLIHYKHFPRHCPIRSPYNSRAI